MNIQHFYEIIDPILAKKPFQDLLIQDVSEWRCFLEFVDAYFRNRNVVNPVVVEIGTENNMQKRFYQELLNATHIGIDIHGNPDILGDSHSQETVDILKAKLDGRKIDLLFIDGDHSYDGVKRDWKLYEPFVRYIVAFHDIYTKGHSANPEVYRLWDEIVDKEMNIPLISFKKNRPVELGWTMGIGIMLVGNL